MGYAGIIVHGGNDSREYIETSLLDTLIAGKVYCVQFYVSTANISGHGIDLIGAYFSNDTILTTGFNNLPYLPQVSHLQGSCIGDTSNWVLISGSFVAAGGERYITIGNFSNDVGTDTSCFIASWPPATYFYIDDVSVIDCGWSGLDESTNDFNVSVFPNPAQGEITLEFNSSIPYETTFEIVNVAGQKVLSAILKKNTNLHKLNLEGLNPGIYMYRIIASGEIIWKEKVVIAE
ncbi:MAG: T9SS type A sorting domain-containing protein [Bacteroidia bacterium]|nr:T9SS type A sorting domain-containing protein [Bacteroidia bacterium]